MANTLYDKYREAQLSGTGVVAWGSGSGGDTIKAILVDVADYTFSQTHQFLSDVPTVARVSTSAALSGKSSTGGVAGANNFAFPAVTGDPSEAIIFYKDTGTATTSPLIAYIDTAIGLPITPTGADINITIPTTGNKLFKL